MELNRDLQELGFVEVPAGSVFVGTDKGGLIHGAERPRYQADLPEFWIMDSLVSESQFNSITDGEGGGDDPVDSISWEQLEDLLDSLKAHLPDSHEIRLPSEVEWLRAREHLGFSLPSGCEEMLWDHPQNSNRGAPLDGRPRLDERLQSMMRRYRASIKTHPRSSESIFRSQAPIFSPQKDTHFRLLIREITDSEPMTIPENADLGGIIRQEAIFALIIGIIPSFLIPILRGYPDYVLEGWPNLIFGGLFISLATSVIWRPRRPTWRVVDGKLTSSG